MSQFQPPQAPPSQPLPPHIPMQQPAPQHPKRPFKKRYIALAAIVALIVIIAVAAGSHGGSSSSPAVTPAAQNTTNAGSTSQPGQTTYKIGDTITTGKWQVTVHSVKTTNDSGHNFITPKAGDTFLVIDATIKNLDSSPQDASTLAQWSLHDASGNAYNEELGFGSGNGGLEGTIAAGQLGHGQFAYQIPVSIHQFTLDFQSDFSGTDLVQWSITV